MISPKPQSQPNFCEVPADFSLHGRFVPDTAEELPSTIGGKTVQLLIPLALQEQFRREAREERDRELQAQILADAALGGREARLHQTRERAAEEGRGIPASPPAYLPPAKRATPTIPAILPRRPPRTVPVFDWEAATARFQALESAPSSGDKVVVARDLAHFAQAMANGP